MTETPLFEVDGTCTLGPPLCHHGTAGTYSLAGQCGNCGARVQGTFTRHHEARDGVLGRECPRCGVAALHWRRGDG